MDKLIFAATKLMVLVALFFSNMPYPAKVLAQTQPPTTSKKPEKKPDYPRISQPRTGFVWPKTPRGLTAVSGRPTGHSSRNTCAFQPPLTALVPFKKPDLVTKQENKSDEIVWGLTTLERPTFWFYVPYEKNGTNSAYFIFEDIQAKKVYQNAIALPPKPGIIGVSLPSTIAPLEVDKTYRWKLHIYCRPQQSATSPVQVGQAEVIEVYGAIQRVSPNREVVQQLAATSDPRVKIAIYAAAGIWYDSLTLLAQLRLANPNDVNLATDWQTLLESVKWSEISTAPLLN